MNHGKSMHPPRPSRRRLVELVTREAAPWSIDPGLVLNIRRRSRPACYVRFRVMRQLVQDGYGVKATALAFGFKDHTSVLYALRANPAAELVILAEYRDAIERELQAAIEAARAKSLVEAGTRSPHEHAGIISHRYLSETNIGAAASW